MSGAPVDLSDVEFIELHDAWVERLVVQGDGRCVVDLTGVSVTFRVDATLEGWSCEVSLGFADFRSVVVALEQTSTQPLWALDGSTSTEHGRRANEVARAPLRGLSLEFANGCALAIAAEDGCVQRLVKVARLRLPPGRAGGEL